MRFLETVTLAQVCVVLGGVVVVLGVLRKAWPFVSKFVAVVNALDDLPASVKTVRDFGSRFDALADKVETIHHEVTPNDGGSMKDSARRTEAAVKRVEAEQLEQRKDTGGLRSEVRTLRDRVDKLRP